MIPPLSNPSNHSNLPIPPSSPTSIGRAAELQAAAYLERSGYSILDRNWRNRWCELDIVAKRGTVVHFVEVKYRATTAFGAPAEYIRHDKTTRLIRAALAWNQAHRHMGPYQIDLVSLTGPLEHPVIDHVPNILGNL
jgi:putative endonuclease